MASVASVMIHGSPRISAAIVTARTIRFDVLHISGEDIHVSHFAHKCSFLLHSALVEWSGENGYEVLT